MGTAIGNVWVGCIHPRGLSWLARPRGEELRRNVGLLDASHSLFSAMSRNDTQPSGVLFTSAPGRTAMLVPRLLDPHPHDEMNGRLFGY
ncbi:hypothetical protein CGRA01v4_10371 [Colletotrichum graminicola]|nr:hypothetical protein CGRA01v4_10371 [Colletotrichum graminicola]